MSCQSCLGVRAARCQSAKEKLRGEAVVCTRFVTTCGVICPISHRKGTLCKTHVLIALVCIRVSSFEQVLCAIQVTYLGKLFVFL